MIKLADLPASRFGDYYEAAKIFRVEVWMNPSESFEFILKAFHGDTLVAEKKETNLEHRGWEIHSWLYHLAAPFFPQTSDEEFLAWLHDREGIKYLHCAMRGYWYKFYKCYGEDKGKENYGTGYYMQYPDNMFLNAQRTGRQYEWYENDKDWLKKLLPYYYKEWNDFSSIVLPYPYREIPMDKEEGE